MFQSSITFCGLVYGPQGHHLDHIATLCALLNIPLVVTDETLEIAAKHYYPGLVVFYFPYLTATTLIVENYQIILTTLPCDLFESIFFLTKKLTHKSPITFWCPHGNSDKGMEGFFAQALRKESLVFVYGKKMIDFFTSKEAFSPSCALITVGNYRYDFYLKHQAFYQKILRQELLSKFSKEQKTYLYAPTWDDHEKLSSFHLALPHLLDNLPDNLNLIVKLHPNTLLAEDLKIKKLIWKYESSPNVLFLENFPLVYPLLDFVDLYIGDTSSIGYDFLSFNKPLFFLTLSDIKLPLHSCGTTIDKESFPHIYTIIETSLTKDKELFFNKRKEIYLETFSCSPNFNTILTQLKNTYNKLKSS